MLTISLSEPEAVRLQWNDLNGSSFSVYRSQAEHEGFELLAQGLTAPLFTDNQVHFDDEAARYFYVVKGISTAGSVVGQFGPVTLQYHAQDRVAFKIMHEYQVVLRVMDNPPLHLFIRKRTGERCENCWNPITKKVRFADCPVCKGSGISQGYYSSVPIKVSTDVSQYAWNPSVTDANEVNLTQIGAWTMPSPIIRPGDVVADILGRRYLVATSTPRTKSQYVIRQMIQLSPLDQGHPSYLLSPSTEVSV